MKLPAAVLKIIWALIFCSAALAQQPNVNFINNEISNEISRLEQLLGPGTDTVTGKLGTMPNGGNCTLQIIVSDAHNASRYYTYTVPLVPPDLCKNYVLETETNGFIKLVPKKTPQQALEDDLAALLSAILKLSGGHRAGGPESASEPIRARPARSPAPAPALPAPQDTTSANPAVLDLPFAPPLSAGTQITNPQGCQPAQTYLFFRINHFDNSVTRFDGCPPQQTVTIPITATRPLQGVLTPDGSTLIVTSYDQGITFIDTATNKVTQTLFAGGGVYPSGIAIRYDGVIAYITSLINSNPQVLVLDVANRTIIGSIPIQVAYPHSVYFTPDGTTALVVCPLTNYVFVIDVLTSSVSTALQIGAPHDVAFNPTGTRAYITSGIYPSSVKVVDTSTYQMIDSYPLNGNPGYILASPDGRFLTVMDYDSANIWIIELATRTVTTIATESGGGGILGLP